MPNEHACELKYKKKKNNEKYHRILALRLCATKQKPIDDRKLKKFCSFSTETTTNRDERHRQMTERIQIQMETTK